MTKQWSGKQGSLLLPKFEFFFKILIFEVGVFL